MPLQNGVRLNYWTIVLLVQCLTSPAAAISYVVPDDEHLLASADAVVAGQVIRAMSDPAAPLSRTRYEFLVEETFKGAAPGATLVLRSPGAFDPQQVGALIVPGMPRLSPSDSMILFLLRLPDGQYAIYDLGLGAFHQRSSGSGLFVERDAIDDAATSGNGARRVRDRERFGRWLHARASGIPAAADYWRTTTVSAAKFALQGNPPARWFEFNEQKAVAFHINRTGQMDLAGGGHAEFETALQAWNDDPGSVVQYVYAGLTLADGGLERADGVNAILFNDPNAELAGVFDCLHGGVVAYGGYRSLGTRSFGQRHFQPIVEVDIVVQNGAGCALSLLGSLTGSSSRAAEVFAHELGHTLGLAHSCSDNGLPACRTGTAPDDALMRPYMHADGRGAALRSDDRAGIEYLYPGAGKAPASAPHGIGGGNNLDGPAAGGGDSGGTANAAALATLLLVRLLSGRARLAECG